MVHLFKGGVSRKGQGAASLSSVIGFLYPKENDMPTQAPSLITAGNMAKTLGVSDAKVKKAILELGLTPASKKGCCTYYTPEDLAKLKAVLS